MPAKKSKSLTERVKELRFDRSTQLVWTPKFGVSVVMIVKDCADSLRKCLASLQTLIHPVTDEIVVLDTGSSDDTVQVAKLAGARVLERPDLRKDVKGYVTQWLPEWQAKLEESSMFKGGCILDFAEARNIVTDAAKNDWVFWIDSDDVLWEAQPGLLRRQIDDLCGTKVSQLFLDYEYAFNELGDCTTLLRRERLSDRRQFHWVGRCHETLIPRPGAIVTLPPGGFMDRKVSVRHEDARKDHTISDVRNYIIIRKEIEEALQAKTQPDTRSIFYMGNAARGLERFTEAETMYAKTLELSGSMDDRYSSAYYCGLMYLAPQIQRPLDARKWARKCIAINYKDPRGYFMLSRVAVLLGRFEEALFWYKTGAALPPLDTLHSYDPEQLTTHPALVAAEAARELGREELVIECLNKAVRGRWEVEPFKSIKMRVDNWLAGRKLVESIERIGVNLKGPDKIARLREIVDGLEDIPDELLKRGLAPIEPADDRPYVEGKDVALFCGHTSEPWHADVTAIGGSEKMVIQMAPRLQKRGFRVTVYANVPQEAQGLHKSGVAWRHWASFDMKRPRDVLISWRSPQAVAMPCPAKKRILWCHDVQNPAAYTPAILGAVDEIWLLSRYHVSTLGDLVKHPLLKDKIWVTRNGLDRALFEETHAKALPRKAKRVVFCSSPDRGAITAIKTFQKAFPNDPEAELHICYGFNKMYMEHANQCEYGSIPDLGRDASRYDYMEKFYAAVDADPRVVYHGRISWADLCALMFQSGVWLYPTRFPEISCMAAMEAQAAGCKVVATEFAALCETVNWERPGKFSTTADPDNAAKALAAAVVQGVDQDADARHFQQVFDFETLADEWSARLMR